MGFVGSIGSLPPRIIPSASDLQGAASRIRYRFRPAYRIAGRPRITVSFPVLFQTYDRPFSFNLFSPLRYAEVGPAVNVYLRKWHYWNFSAYAQAGAQHQSDSNWMMMGQVRAHADRDLWRHWATSFSIGWSNSNIASPSGFERFSIDGGLTHRFGNEKQRWRFGCSASKALTPSFDYHWIGNP